MMNIFKKHKKQSDFKELYQLRPSGVDSLCYAPFNNINFSIFGRASACCENYNCELVVGNQPIEKLWAHHRFAKLRKHISRFDLGYGCGYCAAHIDGNRPEMALLNMFDRVRGIESWPLQMEFELESECPLECVMCTGDLSSTVRRKRELLPARKSPYGAVFFQSLSRFLPRLKYVTFNGGEPFVINKYYELWDELLTVNPDVRIAVTTSGQFLNKRVKSILERGRFDLTLSFESLTNDIYGAIRKNASLDTLLENIRFFSDYAKRKNTLIAVSACPLRINAHEMPAIAEFCNSNQFRLYIQTVMYPYQKALWSADDNALENILENYKIRINRGDSDIEKHNFRQIESFSSLLATWAKKRKLRGGDTIPGEMTATQQQWYETLQRCAGRKYAGEELAHARELLSRHLIVLLHGLSDSILKELFSRPVFHQNNERVLRHIIQEGLSPEVRFSTIKEYYRFMSVSR